MKNIRLKASVETLEMRKLTKVHLIGIGGSGLSAIATMLMELGYSISGSDRELTPVIYRLRNSGAKITIGHDGNNVYGVDLVIRSSAIQDDNVEVQAALSADIPVCKRADFLGQLMTEQKGIAVAGTHGKTTTTAMIAWLMTSVGLNPSYIIGGVSQNLENNAHAGSGEYFVIEADEYDNMFLGLRPVIAVITNIEHDHPDCFPTKGDFFQAFKNFIDCIEVGGLLLVCGDDDGAIRLLNEVAREDLQVYTYGLNEESFTLQRDDASENFDYSAQKIKLNSSGGFDFDIYYGEECILKDISLQVPGFHNVQNALAAICVLDQLGQSLEATRDAIEQFVGTERRFEVVGYEAGVLVIDDYAHHPSEIRATLAAAKSRYPTNRILVVWQPHTFSRTRIFFSQFVESFGDADLVVVTDIYAAREHSPPDGFSSRVIVETMTSSKIDEKSVAFYIPDFDEVREFLIKQMQFGDVLLILSAGDANILCAQIVQDLSMQTKANSDKDFNYGTSD